ncbi:MAG: cysteine hydrolase [Deltaproteobacteria bacterium]|nr:cysteine hydrolase [Deltaproteobacteria bacterium]
MRTVVFDIDTQRDFLEPGGALYVPGGETIVPALRRILLAARDCGVPVVASMDAHTPDDPEFSRFPPHCIAGTRGQEKIPETVVGPVRVASVESDPDPAGGETVILEKRKLSVLEAPLFEATLAALRPERAVIAGVATEYCIRAAALGLRERGLEVALVTDAVRAVDAGDGDRALAELREAGVRLVGMEAALAMFRESGTCAPAAA